MANKKGIKSRFKKLMSSKSLKRNLDMMKLLISDQKFQAEVLSARKALKVYDLDRTDKNAVTKWAKWLESQIEDGNNYYHEIGLRLAKQFGTPVHFDTHIRDYIIFGKIDAPQHNYQGGYYQPGERPSEAGYIPINIYTKLTQNEWDELKHYIDFFGQRLPKFGRIQKIDKYTKMEELLANERQDLLTGKKYKPTYKELADMILGDKRKESKARDMVRNMENLRKKHLKPKVRGKK